MSRDLEEHLVPEAQRPIVSTETEDFWRVCEKLITTPLELIGLLVGFGQWGVSYFRVPPTRNAFE